MRPLSATLSRALLLACACLVFVVPVARAAEQCLSADLDGDGKRDKVVLDRFEPSVVRVWLSSTGATSVLRSRTPVIRIIATDLDGDHRPELIARGTSATLEVWTKKRHGFRSYRPRRVEPGRVYTPKHHRFDDGPTYPLEVTAATGPSLLALAPVIRPRAPAAASPVVFSHTDARIPRKLAVPPFGPRPPPRHA
jgi:hypothetical protein